MSEQQTAPVFAVDCTADVLDVLSRYIDLDDWRARELDNFGSAVTEVVIDEYLRQLAAAGYVIRAASSQRDVES